MPSAADRAVEAERQADSQPTLLGRTGISNSTVHYQIGSPGNFKSKRLHSSGICSHRPSVPHRENPRRTTNPHRRPPPTRRPQPSPRQDQLSRQCVLTWPKSGQKCSDRGNSSKSHETFMTFRPFSARFPRRPILRLSRFRSPPRLAVLGFFRPLIRRTRGQPARRANAPSSPEPAWGTLR